MGFRKSMISSAIMLFFSTSSFATNNNNQATFQSNPDLLDIHNRCIIRLHDDVASSDVKGLAHALALQGKSTVKYLYRHSIKGFTVNMPCMAAVVAFGKDNHITSLTPDSIISITKGKPPKRGGGDSSAPQQVSYGTIRVGGPLDGTNYTAWIIDTGIDLNHPDLNVDTSRGFTIIKSGGMQDQNGHGTHVAGIIGALDNSKGSIGVAPNTTVVPVRVLDRRGSGSTSGVIAGVDYVATNASAGDCVNMSLGGGVNQNLDDAVVNAALSSGAYFVLAAGNSSDDAKNHSPARVNATHVWTISAIDSNDNMPTWSNYGNPPVDYAAPGVGIFSLWKDGGTNTISGTSMAAPHACAVIMMSNGSPTTNGYASSDPDGYADGIIYLSN